jgi:hypothetical protein
MIRTGLFRIVLHERVDEYHRRGWMVVADLGEWSALMWKCECGEG